ncbi:hypothetical protein CJ231_03525 [Hoylesella buccalis]|uniref:Uncharacterized protein n=1 Tax=Hoylesella buccalis TaxID=28127 RepID=A0A2N6QSN4_9BACT|nr:hypothetical protein CJ231_03525 [Hoylesella buccalis]
MWRFYCVKLADKELADFHVSACLSVIYIEEGDRYAFNRWLLHHVVKECDFLRLLSVFYYLCIR